ncbi:PR domain zinc finger protein 2 [Synchiropus splendidus]|uniref:PR domain zinc finger protein 2 n=1 Tax=Synchiropus splendidus TaxID=270530 RepID=UPI00237DD0CA|nr:PR domain zinc finger protein 2 [Synchiropus splendidus]
MWDGEEGLTEKDEKPSTEGPSAELQGTHPMPVNDPGEMDLVAVADKDKEEEDEQGGANEAEHETPDQPGLDDASTPPTQPAPVLNCSQKTTDSLPAQLGSSSPVEQEPDGDPDFDIDPDPDGELEEDAQSESHPCLHCERRFSTRQGLERHVHIHAVTNQQTQVFKCRYCSKPFGSQVGRRRHERRHESGSKKKPGSLAGTANLISHMGQTDVSSPDSTGQTNHFIAIGSQFARAPLHNSDVQRAEASPQFDRPYVLDENGESKELHPCKYCNKAFGTHTNMRRHQRRIHERHLLPKGVRRKGMLLQETTQQQQPDESPSASPPPVYVPSADTEDEADRDDYVVDISKNISENLSFYIDGKIVSTSTVSTCEVIEVDSRSAALFGLDTVIINPSQFSQAVKMEGRTSAAKSISGLQQSSSKRRTSTPPLVPNLKVETDTQSFTATSSSTSSSTNLLVGGLFQQETDPSHLQREKNVYLSPKLKQLLQTKDSQKTTITLLPESNSMASPASVASLPGSSGRFKRRTSSPPSSPQHSPASKTESFQADARGLYTLKVPKLETNFSGSFQDQEESIALIPPGESHQLCPNSGGKACNQQPLDLSNTVSRWNDAQINFIQGDSALDLSFHRKNILDSEAKAPQPLAKKKKPITSMLEKVLMNEYAGLSMAGDEGVAAMVNTSSNNSCSSNVTLDSAHPSPPSLTPVTLNPSSPANSIVTSPTPPPPVLPTIPSPLPNPDSPSSQPSESSGLRPFPILSPEMSPRKEPEEDISAEENRDKEDGNISEPRDSNPNTPVEELDDFATSGSPEHKPVDVPATEDVSLTTSHSLQNGDTHLEAPDAAVSAQTESPPASISPAPSPALDNPSPPPSPPRIKVKEEQIVDEVSVTSHEPLDVNSSPQSPVPTKLPNKACDGGEIDFPYCKNFVCNVCEAPFHSMKELGVHIAEHAAEWPFKCEFCVQLFGDAPALLSHRTTLHGVGKIFVCSVCCKEFAFLSNLQQHQKDLHPNETCLHTTVESGKLRPQNYTDPSKAKEESSPSTPAPEAAEEASPQQDLETLEDEPDVNGNHAEEEQQQEQEEEEADDPTEELYTTIKIMASEGGKPKGPDVRLGINQHYPSYKPPPFPYHSRSHTGSVASATNFTTHNIPQTFTTAIRCTKCGNSFDNMPELHKHILACANASDKKRYTPKKNPIPLKQIVKSPNGVVSPSAAAGQNAFRRMGQPKRLNFGQDAGKTKLSALSKKKNQLVQKAISQKNKAANTAKKAVKVEEPKNVCPHCNREFTYTASLTKHISISCPMKPVVKKDKKVSAEVKKEPVADKSMTLRKKATDPEQMEPDSKPLGKTRARSSGAVEPDPSQTTKGKNARAAAPQKRPASSPQPDPTSKKQKKVQAQSLPPTPSVPDTPDDAAPRPASRMQRMGKVAAPKKVAEVKPPSQQPKKEERFSLRTRERARGPVTRSLQTTGASEDGGEESAIPEPKATQEVK